ncbi:TlpA family protein disulfide reductase [Flavobacterium sp.]|uniref:TlpA family protein disulfide reductase n=1 Tax=Flavobacterium sp. TaxID=239 RepID=UPI0035282A30
MIAYSKKIPHLTILTLLLFFSGCQKEFGSDNFTAYFGGEVINPKSNFVLFLKDDEVVDTLFLDKNNRFIKKFDSLAPGLYTFKHEPEYQYVYFDKNDSLMVRINPIEFDESIVFCGRGDDKNNFLMELYLKNEADKNKMFDVFDYPVEQFIASCDSAYKSKVSFYEAKKEKLKWTDDFDLFAKTMLNYHHFSKKEIYPMAHKMRTGENISNLLPADYYAYRKEVDFNNNLLVNYSPFVRYLTHFLGNVSFSETHAVNVEDEDLAQHIHKLNIADTLFKNEKIKNKILDNIAFSYLLEDQNIVNNQKFLLRYNELSTDKSKQNEINKIGTSIQNLKSGNELPNVALVDLNGKLVNSQTLFNRKTVIFFWTENAESHLLAVHKKALAYYQNNPNYQFVAINIDEDQTKWKNLLANYRFGTINEFRAANFEELKDKWVITKLHRTIILDENGKIHNGFVNLFDVQFAAKLK